MRNIEHDKPKFNVQVHNDMCFYDFNCHIFIFNNEYDYMIITNFLKLFCLREHGLECYLSVE